MNADELTALILGLVLGLSAGWCWGHATARVRHVPIGALRTDDEEALLAADRARFDQLIASLDLPDDPRNTT